MSRSLNKLVVAGLVFHIIILSRDFVLLLDGVILNFFISPMRLT